jgi:phycobilisome linker polypeptide
VTVGRVSRIPFLWCVVVTLLLTGAYRSVRWSYVDLANNLSAAGDSRSWHELVSDALTKTVEYRPLLDIGTRAAYKVIGLSLGTYKTIVVLEFALILGILVVAFRPIGRDRAVAAVLALSVVVGLHTSQILFLFNPLNAYATSMLLVLTAMLLTLTPRFRGYEGVMLPLTLVAILWLEIGVLILPLLLVAWLRKAPGTTWRSIAAAGVGIAIYMTARLVFRPGLGQLTSPDSGLGFSSVTPAESAALFANAPWLFWLYNVTGTLMTVLASEPRSGRFQFIESLLRGNTPFWMWLHVISSLATTGVVFAVLVLVRPLPQRDRLLAAFGAVLIAGGSALGFLYTRDRIGLPVGIGYGMLVYVAVSALLHGATTRWVRIPAIAVTAVLGICWSIRTAEMYVALRDTAFDYHLEWTDRWEQFAGGARGPIIDRLRASALERYPNDVRRDPLWTFQLFERRFEPVVDACESNARRVVDQVYTRLLGHAATDDDGSRWAERIEDGEGTVRDAVRGVALSREYISRLEQRGNPANAVATLYRDLFAREPDPEGGKWAIQIASSQGFAAVIEQFIGSSEYRHGPGDWHVPGGRVPFCR